MERINIQPKMSKIDLNTMFFEISLSMKGEFFRVRSASLSKIINTKNVRPDALSKISFENAIQNLIPKIKDSLKGTDKQLGKIFTDDNGKIMFSIENIIYENSQEVLNNNDISNSILSAFNEFLKNLSSSVINGNQLQNLSFVSNNNNIISEQEECQQQQNLDIDEKIITFKDVCVEWLQHLLGRTKKSYEDEEYLSPTTLESYNRNIWNIVFPYLEEHPESDNILIFSESNVDEILNTTQCRDTQRILLISLRLIFDYAIEQSYIKINPIANKKLKKKKQIKKSENEYDFIEEDQRALWINCMIKEINSSKYKHTDAALSFLFTLLHGTRPEETCGVRWMDLNFDENDFFVQNAYKNNPIYDNKTMKRIGWKPGDGPLKTPESYRHIPIDLLIKQLLLEHKKNQKSIYKEKGKKWSEKEYVFHNSTATPFTPKVLSRNFLRFVRRNKLPHMVLYGLRHSFATHCRNSGMTPEVLARLMGHTEYETTQKYYIHISSQQKKDELQKIQKQDLEKYLGDENKDLTHLQNNIKSNKHISNLQEVQKEDMINYLQSNDETLIILKKFIQELKEKEKIVA